jgi:hypothetical protein
VKGNNTVNRENLHTFTVIPSNDHENISIIQTRQSTLVIGDHGVFLSEIFKNFTL